MSSSRAIDGHCHLERGEGGLPCIQVANDLATATIYLNGAHVAAFQPRHAEHPVLWTSARSHYAVGSPIRGGIPVCWPWFADMGPDPEAPAHGIARTATWNWIGSGALASGATRLLLALDDDRTSRRWWPLPFALRLVVTVGRELDVALQVRNPGPKVMTWTGALHTYLAVSDCRAVRVEGLDRVRYRDRMDETIKTQSGPVLFAAETDRIYHDTGPATWVVDPVWQRRIQLRKRGSNSTVVWNPWIAKSHRMPDFGNDEWPHMCCVETARAGDDTCTVAPGGRHELGVTIGLG